LGCPFSAHVPAFDRRLVPVQRPRVRDLIIAETRGNPLALLELPRGLSPADLAGGFGLPGAASLIGRIEDSFARQLAALPDQTRRWCSRRRPIPPVTHRGYSGR
jgi:hypothetical protein